MNISIEEFSNYETEHKLTTLYASCIYLTKILEDFDQKLGELQVTVDDIYTNTI